MPSWLQWSFGFAVAALLLVVPIVHYRYVYDTGKRFRTVAPGKLYRSGQMTADGFTDAIRRYGIKTVINLQDEYEDPEVDRSYFNRSKVRESDLCAHLGAHYVFLPPDLLARRRIPAERPAAIDRFLEIMDDESKHPVLIHCRAGLHRTGVLSAVYRMEYDGWSPEQALRELKAIGFGEFACEPANDYINQYILTYRRGVRHGTALDR